MNTSVTVRNNMPLLVITIIFVLQLLLCCMFFTSDVRACVDVTVRDAAFSESRDIHRICVIGNTNDPKSLEIFDLLEFWFNTSGTGLNIELLHVNADEPNVHWEEYGIPSAPPSLPVVVLAGSRNNERKRFFIDYWVPFPSVEDLKILKTSPAREAIQRESVRRIAVLLYIPGSDSKAGSARDVLDSVVQTWSQRDSLDICIVQVSRTDGRERLLLSFTGVEKSEKDWVGVIFGRGKLMAPLEGEEITEVRLNEKIETLMGECTCLISASILGVDIPVVWDQNLDDSLLALRKRSDDNIVNLMSISALSDIESFSENPGSITYESESGTQFIMHVIWTLSTLMFIVCIVTVAIVWPRNKNHKTNT